MRVGISAYLLHAGSSYRAAGVSSYVRQLLTHLPRVRPDHSYIAFHGRDAPQLSGVQSVLSAVPTDRPPARVAWEQLALPLQAKGHRVDVLHGTVNVLPLLLRTPTVVTVHDLSFMRYPDRFLPAKVAYLRVAVATSVRRAGHVIAVSEHTRHDVLDLLGASADRISVVHQGVDCSFHLMSEKERERFRRRTWGGRPYLLHVGTLEPRKNLDLLIRAFSEVRRKLGIPHALALVGGRGWMSDSLATLIAKLGLEEDVRLVGFVPAEELPLWYNCADLFAYPSAYEGFGLPVLEAMACGLPAITSASSALQELAGGACLMVEPDSEEALQEAMAQLLQKADLREQMREAGLHRARQFSWAETARKTVQVYERVAEGASG